MRNGTQETVETVIVGGGLAGLAAAAYVARASRTVVVLERSSAPGGRAITNDAGGFKFNLGPHALYKKGAAARVLRELGVPFRGGTPPADGSAILGGALHRISASPLWFLTTRLLTAGGKMEAARLLLKTRSIDPTRVRGLSTNEWLASEARRPDARRLLGALVRVATYGADHDRMSAEVAVRQLQLGLGGVWYLDGGWQVLVDGLRQVAERAGARIETGAPVAAIEPDASGCAVRLDGSGTLRARSVIVATEASTAARLVPGLAMDSLPVRAACLDIGLRRLPQPTRTFALGLDEPTYFSVHSRAARLAPGGQAMVHIAKYLHTDERNDAHALERELEGVLDLVQPRWREELAERRFLPNMTVVSALATPPRDLAGRPGPAIGGVPNVYIAGDWVGDEGWLSDASLASAQRAAALAIARERAAVGAPVRAG
jgi:phytoene dehydrogenase-like protein